MILSSIPLVAALVGLIIYAFAGNAKAAEIGKILFFAGALVALLALEHSGQIKVLP